MIRNLSLLGRAKGISPETSCIMNVTLVGYVPMTKYVQYYVLCIFGGKRFPKTRPEKKRERDKLVKK